MAVKILDRAACPTCAQRCTVESLSLREGPPLLSMKVASTHCIPLKSDSTSIPPPWAASREVLGEESPRYWGGLANPIFLDTWVIPNEKLSRVILIDFLSLSTWHSQHLVRWIFSQPKPVFVPPCPYSAKNCINGLVCLFKLPKN